MKKVGLVWRVDPAHWEEYKDIHLNPWPELIEAFQEVGVHNFNAFAFNNLVFGYLEIEEGKDVFEVLDELGKTEIKQKWDKEVTVWVLPEVEEGSGIQFMEMERIFYVP